MSTGFVLFEALAERRIEEAMIRGDFDDLPGMGRPVDLTEDPLVPSDQRMANRILKNAGYVPAEVGQRRELAELEASAGRLGEDHRRAVRARILYLRLKLSAACGARSGSLAFDQYASRIVDRVAGTRRTR